MTIDGMFFRNMYANRIPIKTSGIYFLYNKDELVYVGESSNVWQRIGQHISEASKDFDSWSYTPCNEDDRFHLEAIFIELIRPKYNVKGNSFFNHKTNLLNLSNRQVAIHKNHVYASVGEKCLNRHEISMWQAEEVIKLLKISSKSTLKRKFRDLLCSSSKNVSKRSPKRLAPWST